LERQPGSTPKTMKSSKSTTEKPPAPPPRTVPEIVSYSVGGIALSYFPKAEFEFAIGGIDAKNLDMVLRSGIKRVAVQSAVTDDKRPSEICRDLKKRLSTRK